MSIFGHFIMKSESTRTVAIIWFDIYFKVTHVTKLKPPAGAAKISQTLY